MHQIINKNILLSISMICFFFATTIQAQNKTIQERVYIKIEIKGMSCPYCAFGMENDLKNITGVDNVEIELKEGLAYISTPINEKPFKEHIVQIIIDGGFTAGEIEFSSKPFIKRDEKATPEE